MRVLQFEEEEFFRLIEEVVARVSKNFGTPKLDKWIDTEEAMRMLRITSKTTLQKLRDNGEIRYSQPMAKVILYDSDSILAYLEKHAKDTF